jgi:hypothetical protein
MPHKHYMVALGELIMKPHMSMSPLISVGNNGIEEEDTVNHMISCSEGKTGTTAQQRKDTGQPHYSRQRRKNGVRLGIGTATGDDTNMSTDPVPPPCYMCTYMQMSSTGGMQIVTTATTGTTVAMGWTNPLRLCTQSTDCAALEDGWDKEHPLVPSVLEISMTHSAFGILLACALQLA